MYRAIRAFYRFSKYPETKPLRWRAFRTQVGYDAARIAVWTVTAPIWVPAVAFLLVTLPIAWLHDYCERNAPLAIIGDMIQPVRAWWERACEELNPTYLDAVKRHER